MCRLDRKRTAPAFAEARRSPSLRAGGPSQLGAFEAQQRLFGVEPAGAAVAAEPALREHAVARNDDRDRVAAAGAADRARRRAHSGGEVAVAAGLAVGDLL